LSLVQHSFRADWLWLDDTGKVTAYINQRGSKKGLIPVWDPAGVTHAGMGETCARSQIRFAKIYGSGRADVSSAISSPFRQYFPPHTNPSNQYVYVKCTRPSPNHCDYQILAWRNTGGGGAHQKGDGARWCDMTGTGNDDYVFIDHTSKLTIFRNRNAPPNTDYSGWVDKGVVLDLSGTSRSAIHLGDWDGDGKCDVIITDKKTGSLDVYFTRWDQTTDMFSFSPRTRVVSSGCTQGWGVGPTDLGIRFADIDGDRRVDYLCLEPNGRVTGWLNKPSGLQWQSQIKFSEKRDRAEHRFADVNGDGRADFLWVDRFTGETEVWYNMGPRQISGSSFWWEPKGKLYQGASMGENLHFVNLGGQDRADMVVVEPKTGLGWVWFNGCPYGGDDGPIRDPHLPVLPGEKDEWGMPGKGDDGGGRNVGDVGDAGRMMSRDHTDGVRNGRGTFG